MQPPASTIPGEQMQREATFLGSSIGKKVVMATSGLVLFGFVVGHMIGNLQVFLGGEALNEYAELLRHFLHGQGNWSFGAGNGGREWRTRWAPFRRERTKG